MFHAKPIHILACDIYPFVAVIYMYNITSLVYHIKKTMIPFFPTTKMVAILFKIDRHIVDSVI